MGKRNRGQAKAPQKSHRAEQQAKPVPTGRKQDRPIAVEAPPSDDEDNFEPLSDMDSEELDQLEAELKAEFADARRQAAAEGSDGDDEEADEEDDEEEEDGEEDFEMDSADELDGEEEAEFDSDAMEFEEDGEEFEMEEESDDEEGDSDDDEEGDDGAPPVEVNWDAREMFTRHIDAVNHNIDRTIPDGENLVDRHDFGTCLRKSIATTLITVMQSEEDDASDVSVDTAAPMEDEDTYGVVSFVPVGGFAKKFESCAGLLTLLARPPEHTLEQGTAAARLLKADGAAARALLFFNDHLNIVPPQVIAQVHAGVLEELDGALKAKEFDGVRLNAVSHIVMLARVQRSASEQPSAVKKTTVKTSAPFDLGAHDFARWEDEVYFRRRDKRIATTVIRFPRYQEDQEEQDVPRCVCFALTLDGFREAVGRVGMQAQFLLSRTQQ